MNGWRDDVKYGRTRTSSYSEGSHPVQERRGMAGRLPCLAGRRWLSLYRSLSGSSAAITGANTAVYSIWDRAFCSPSLSRTLSFVRRTPRPFRSSALTQGTHNQAPSVLPAETAGNTTYTPPPPSAPWL